MIKSVSSLMLAVVLVIPMFLYGGNTGRVTGHVVDMQTGEPLVGANIMLVGTMMGAATDMEGRYNILNVPPGTYALRASYIGYTSREYQNVRVNVDLTATVDIELSTELIETDEVVVLGSRLIQRDATATAATFDAQRFEALPIETFEQALQIQAGVTVGAGGDIHIRGGRANEVLFMVDGVPLNDAFDNKITTGIVSTSSIQELSVISGAFNAEYGNAQSGVVNIVTKQPPRSLTGRFSIQSGDMVGGESGRFLNSSNVNPVNSREIDGMLGGPLPFLKDNLSFLVSGRYFEDEGYLYGKRLVTYASDSEDYLVLGDGALVSMNPDRLINLHGKLSLNTRDLRLSLSYLRKDRKYGVYSNVYRLAPDFRPVNYQTSDTYTVNANYFISPTTFANVVLSYVRTDDEARAFEDMNDPRYRFRGRDLAFIANANNPNADSLSQVLLDQYGLTVSELVRFNIGPNLDRVVRTSDRYSGRFSITRQFGNVHLVKAGIEGTWYDIYRDGISLIQLGTRPDSDFNIFNEEMEIPDANTRSRNIYRGEPYEVGAYVQNKMEFEEFVLNIGLRYDAYDPNTDVPLDFENLDETEFTKASVKSKLSPRLSFAHSVTDRSKLFFSYGHFFQMPPYGNMYTGQEAFTNPLVEIRTGILSPVGGDQAVGNPDLKPQTTVSYEVGYEQELTNDIALYLKAYYRNIRNLLATDIGFLSNGAVYAFYRNRDYGNVRGVNLTLRKRLSNFYGFTIDYTYQVAEGNASSPTQAYLNYRAESEEQKKVVYLDWDQPHTLRWTMDFAMNGWQGGLIGKFESGYPYTPALGSAIQGGQRDSEENSGRRPPIFNVDLTLSKEFLFGSGSRSLAYGIYFKVYNLFDTRNELFVFSNSGRATFASDPALAGFVQFTQRPDFFSKPREVFLGTYIRF
jgi:outer membrane receptor protein involved in Fe transport